jgi:hypothetical protein
MVFLITPRARIVGTAWRLGFQSLAVLGSVSNEAASRHPATYPGSDAGYSPHVNAALG